MVSPVPSGTQNQPLSYADRVKKAQGIPISNVNSTQARPQPTTVSSPSTSSPSIPAKPAQPPAPNHNAEVTVKDQKPPPPPEPTTTTSNELNGDVKSAHVDPVAGPSSASSARVTPAPVVNVWNVRKAQMARGLPARQPPVVAPPSHTQKPAPNHIPDTPVHSAPATSPPVPAPSAPGSQQNGHTMSPVTTINGTDSNARSVNEPSSTQPRNADKPTPPPSQREYADAWPEVGKTGSAPVAPANRRNTTGSKDREEQKDESAENESSSVAPRKAEKTKWVPIPAEELQAAADAQRANRSQKSAHGRSRSHQQQQHRAQASSSISASSASPAGSASGGDSQNRNRAQSSGARDKRGSQAGSASHSRTQSRTGSVQGSPRHAAARGGRRLPEEGVPVPGVSRSMRSSRAGSPQSNPHLYMQDATSTGIAEPMARRVAGGPSNQMGNGSRSESPYYQGSIPGSRGQSSYQSTPPITSPVAGPYVLPSVSYPPHSMPQYPIGVPSYSVYPAYAYPYHQPYVFWSGGSSGPHSQNISQNHSPSTYPVPLANGQAGPVSPQVLSSALHAADSPGANVNDQGRPSETRPADRTRPRVLSFGSIDITAADASSNASITNSGNAESLASSGTSDETPAVEVQSPTTLAQVDPRGTLFAIGLAPGDPGPSRKKGTSESGAVNQFSPNPSEGVETTSTAGASLGPADQDVENVTQKVVDLTVQESKWEFGTTKHEDESDAADAAEFARLSARATAQELPPVDLQEPVMLDASSVPDAIRVRLSPLAGVIDPSGLPPTPTPGTATVLYAPPPMPLSPGDEFRVRDYGWGFGRRGAPAPAPPPVLRDERPPRDGTGYAPRPRRGSYNGEPFERGGYSGRRGGRGRGGYRGGRGAYQGEGYPSTRGQRGTHQRVPFNAAASGSVPFDTTYFVPPVPAGPYPGYEIYPGYAGAAYAPVAQPVVSPSTTSQSSAPVPNPITKLSFPLDPLRYYLLGQLEYYLSEDNLAHDLYLRKQMDSRGWIPIPLIASFNRVKTLTYDLQLVRDVLTLSSLVEVRGDWVRMYRWARYVLPDAPPSILELAEADPQASQLYPVEEDILTHPPSGLHAPHDALPPGNEVDAPGLEAHQAVYDDEELDAEDEDEDDVEFVLGGDANRSWDSERKLDVDS